MMQQVVCARRCCLLSFMVVSSVGFSPEETAGVGVARAVLREKRTKLVLVVEER